MSEALAQELRAFGVRVVIVEPGIIDTRMARNIEGIRGSKVYPQVRRCGRPQGSDAAGTVYEIPVAVVKGLSATPTEIQKREGRRQSHLGAYSDFGPGSPGCCAYGAEGR
jgi:NAD(P)-dependent dehydrogenase (short-subunit alcohol dehydrogenase family)